MPIMTPREFRLISVMGRAVLLGTLCLLLVGCVPTGFAQTPFQREMGDVVSLLSASALTIEQAHTGKLDHHYAKASLDIYASMLAETPPVTSLSGAPTERVAVLDELIDEARHLVDAPCLATTCDWQSQVNVLREAAATIEQVSA